MSVVIDGTGQVAYLGHFTQALEVARKLLPGKNPKLEFRLQPALLRSEKSGCNRLRVSDNNHAGQTAQAEA